MMAVLNQELNWRLTEVANMITKRIDRTGIAWLALGFIWGSNFVFMKWSTELITPMQVVLVRVALGFLPVLIYAWIKRQLRITHFRHSLHFVVMAGLAAAMYYYGFAKGTSMLPSGIAGAVSGAIPLFSLVAAAIFLPDEKFRPARLAGLLVGFIGVLIIANPFQPDAFSNSGEGVAYMMMGSASLGISFVYARKFITPLELPAAALTTYQLGFATLMLMLVTDFENIGRVTENSRALWALMIGLGLIGTGLAYIIYYYIVAEMGAVKAATVTYVPPLVALLIGAVFLREPIRPLDYLAAGLILAGVILVTRKKKRA